MSIQDPSPSRERILDAACQLFLENGYRVSMDAVAQQAGVSKQTVYAHFSSKDVLFQAAIEALMTPMHASLESHREDLETSLRALAATYCRHTHTPANAALGRMLVAEAPRFPRAARQLFRAGSGAVLSRLAKRIGQSMRRGELRGDDPQQAAELFLSMLNGIDPQRHLLGLRSRGRKAQDKWASDAVQIFLRAYQPTTSGPSSRKPSA